MKSCVITYILIILSSISLASASMANTYVASEDKVTDFDWIFVVGNTFNLTRQDSTLYLACEIEECGDIVLTGSYVTFPSIIVFEDKRTHFLRNLIIPKGKSFVVYDD